jgi:hypothetical protein
VDVAPLSAPEQLAAGNQRGRPVEQNSVEAERSFAAREELVRYEELLDIRNSHEESKALQ